jgi:HicB family
MPQTTIHLRVPPSLHKRLREIGAEESTSLNQTIVLLLTSATGGFNDFNDQIESPRDADTSEGTTTPGDRPDDAERS